MFIYKYVLCMCVYIYGKRKGKSLVMSDSVTPYTVAQQAPLSMEFSKQEYWSGQPNPSPGDLCNPVIVLVSTALQADFLLHQGGLYACMCIYTYTFIERESIIKCFLYSSQNDHLYKKTRSYHCPNMLFFFFGCFQISQIISKNSFHQPLLMTLITMMVRSLSQSQTSWTMRSSGSQEALLSVKLVEVMESQLSYLKY